MYPRKLKFPREVASVPCAVVFLVGELDENGHAETAARWEGKCIYREGGKEIYKADKRMVQRAGTVWAEGDMAPSLAEIAGGTVTVFSGTEKERSMRIEKGSRRRNPDGSVHHTCLELV